MDAWRDHLPGFLSSFSTQPGDGRPGFGFRNLSSGLHSCGSKTASFQHLETHLYLVLSHGSPRRTGGRWLGKLQENLSLPSFRSMVEIHAMDF
uniref:Macaca fascicularis brain cDNA clone: QflA-16419, similar to human rab11-family interacting protein 4 (RAB11-FIP4), mRNA, RefSeq: NM_032932.2 n=1 Tax=Macaca fascicularis TaxID=9541 RepID=I7GMB5_MACFA|nr:unnamed protein product [Macaca fascicularis]